MALACVVRLFAIATLVSVTGIMTPAHALSEPLPPLPYRGREALVIGIDDYSSAAYGNPWPPLRNAVNDAEEVARVLANLGFRVRLLIDPGEGGATATSQQQDIPQIDRHRLTLTRETLADEIREFLIGGNVPEAQMLLWYSGHGATVGREGFLVAPDAPPSAERSFPRHALQLREIAAWIRIAKAKHVLAVFDSCFAGTVFESRTEVRPTIPVAEMVALPVRQFITSGGAGEKVDDAGQFRMAFIDALEGDIPELDPNGTGFVTASDLGLYLAARIRKQTRNRQTPQYGELLDREFDQGNFVFDLRPRDVGNGPATKQDLGPLPLRGLSPTCSSDGEIALRPFSDCADCPAMVPIPPDLQDDPEAGRHDRFAIGAHEVTFDEWDACVRAGGCTNHLDDVGWGRGDHPAIRVTWDDARQYARWLSFRTGRHYRLPSEAEWERAARACEKSAFPQWHLDPATLKWTRAEQPRTSLEPDAASCHGCTTFDPDRPMPVGRFQPNRYGLFDVHGNVWEWVDDCWTETRGENVAHQSESNTPDQQCERRVVRGGSWANDASLASLSSRAGAPAASMSTGIGFRVACDYGD